ncbi:MAG: LysM peptidoglycan-binding domain-containing protein [Candidatus Omnitrophota bacterium]|jgi:nucleoid-associated protein YgaU
MKRLKLTGIFVLLSTLALSGCVARTYTLTRDRIDQDTSTGNRGYLMGKAPEASSEGRKTTRTTRVVEIELGFQKKSPAGCPASLPVASLNEESAPTMMENQGEEMESVGTFEKYTVEKNDTLQKISMKFYKTTRKWMKIYDANKNTLKGPDKVYPGQVLNIPVDSVPSTQESAMPKENLK